MREPVRAENTWGLERATFVSLCVAGAARPHQANADGCEVFRKCSHTQEQGALPPSLAVLGSQPGIRLSIADPVTGAPYEYAATGARTYRLCARFSTDTALQAPNDYPSSDAHWAHGIGRHCFDRTAATATGLPSD